MGSHEGSQKYQLRDAKLTSDFSYSFMFPRELWLIFGRFKIG